MFGKKFLYVLRSDPRENLPLSYPVCPADDRRKSVAAVLQHCTLIVGRVLGSNALAAVGSSYTLMTFLTSIFLGLSMGAGALFSIYQGRKDLSSLKLSILHAFLLILAVTLVLNLAVYAGIEPILTFLRVPDEVRPGMRTYLLIIFAGLIATSVYNFFSCMLRALGNSSVPLIFLAVSAVLNIALDLLFVAVLPFGIAGAALATVLAQYVSAVGILLYVLLGCRQKKNGVSAIPF
jgi:Na+-driven multidrug efflux pump